MARPRYFLHFHLCRYALPSYVLCHSLSSELAHGVCNTQQAACVGLPSAGCGDMGHHSRRTNLAQTCKGSQQGGEMF